ncbi:MAG: phosphatase PAP2 family protein [Halobacteriota archaeon]
MRRDLGVAEWIHEAIPEAVLVGIGLLTQLGDVWFLAVVITAVYALRPGDRDGVAFVAGLSLVGAASLELLKSTLARPRPPLVSADPEALTGLLAELYRLTATADGYGLPSGHAMLGAIVYLGLATAISVGRRRTRLRVATVLILLVAASRVLLGVHYLVDVLLGLALGTGIVLLGVGLRRRLGRGAVPVAFAVGLAIALGNAGAHGLDAEATALLGATIGAMGGWYLGQPTWIERTSGRGRDWRRVAVGVPVLAVLVALLLVAAGGSVWPDLGLGLAVAVGVGVVLALPTRGG